MSSDWSTTPLDERLAWVARFRKLLAQRELAICQAISEDVSKSRFEALTSDVIPLLAACKWLEANAGYLLAPRSIRQTPFWLKGLSITQMRAPLGRVAIIATWNYPVQLLGIQLVQALAAGNTVVVKPSERSPKSQKMLLDLAIEARLPEGVLSWTQATREAGATLLAGERFDHVIFTGSTAVGKTIAQTVAPTLTHVTLELSGRDSALVLDDADPVLAAKSIWAAVCINAGQSCIGPRRAIVHGTVYKPFSDALSTLAKKTQPRVMIDEQAAGTCYELIKSAIEMGGRDAMGEAYGTPNPQGSYPPPVGRKFRPTAVLDCPSVASLVDGKHFGPALAVVRVERMDQMLDVHHRCNQHLATSVFTASPARARRLAPLLGATSIVINDCIVPTAHPGVSIGGRGESGVGLSRGSEGLLAMTRPIYISTSKGLMRKSLQEPSPFMIGLLAKAAMWIYKR